MTNLRSQRNRTPNQSLPQEFCAFLFFYNTKPARRYQEPRLSPAPRKSASELTRFATSTTQFPNRTIPSRKNSAPHQLVRFRIPHPHSLGLGYDSIPEPTASAQEK